MSSGMSTGPGQVLLDRLSGDVDDFAPGGARSFTFVNPAAYSALRNDPALYEGFDRIGIDGISMVWLLTAAGIRVSRRISFDMTSLAPLVFREAIGRGMTVCFVGSGEDTIRAAVARIRESFPGLDVAESVHGYPDHSGWRKQVEHVCTVGPDIVVAGMGVPYQEGFIRDLRAAGWSGTAYTCGGMLHQCAEAIPYYPAWINRMELRWAYRIWREPHLFSRYAVTYPRWSWVMWRDVRNALRPMAPA